ncbi:hypothetical protein ED92_08785 [Amycolatopsis sp. MJM2582]|uniref:hypothetical protein n=1 Tax=Amycolatopsis sp. MJM2582 TaxID=1427749 RepID=UPI0005088C3E|nr:hypothetical protein [Amycolatopsis sp. MJM2582]KFZ83985.1 hypothetical protein ED92_08785 [Amycolatopsis sp. MJM2582]
MTGAFLVYIPAFVVSIYLASRPYPTRRTKLFALSAHLLVSAALVTGLTLATVSPKEPGIVGLWSAILGPGAVIALCRLVVVLWHRPAGATGEQTGTPPKNDQQR